MRCFAFFNFGNKCILELLVATFTLRKHYSGEIVWMLDKNDEWNKKLSEQVTNLNVKIIWSDFSKIKRNTKSAIKPALFKQLFDAGYESVIICDGDLIFLQPIEELFIYLESKGVVLTNFCGWKTNGKIMRARINNLKGILDQKEIDNICAGHPAVNIGIIGFHKQKGKKALKKWADLTNKLAGRHIADEIAAHVIYPYYPCHIANLEYNASAKIGDLSTIEKNKVVHFHGGSQGGGGVDIRFEKRRRSSRLWMACLYSFYKSDMVPNSKTWEQYATGGVCEILEHNPTLPEECAKEFLL